MNMTTYIKFQHPKLEGILGKTVFPKEFSMNLQIELESEDPNDYDIYRFVFPDGKLWHFSLYDIGWFCMG